MAYEVQGIVALEKDAPVSQETIIVPDPGPGEVIVSPQACGVCHTDLHYRQGNINDDFPFLLGHEAAGKVEVVGEGVEKCGPRRLCDFELARRLWRVSGLRAGTALVLLCHPQRHPENDPEGWHRAHRSPGHRSFCRKNAGVGRSGHQGQSCCFPQSCRTFRLRHHGWSRCGSQHRRCLQR